eukprot:6816764-Prymnesium_polylepis.1
MQRSDVLRDAARRTACASGVQNMENSSPEHGRPMDEKLVIRELRAIELGLLLNWIHGDETEAVQDELRWSSSAGTLQSRWEEAAGLVDTELLGLESAAASSNVTHAIQSCKDACTSSR